MKYLVTKQLTTAPIPVKLSSIVYKDIAYIFVYNRIQRYAIVSIVYKVIPVNYTQLDKRLKKFCKKFKGGGIFF